MTQPLTACACVRSSCVSQAVPPLITMLSAETAAERAPAMAALWNLSLRSSRCEEIRAQMIGCEILTALSNIAEMRPNAMVRSLPCNTLHSLQLQQPAVQRFVCLFVCLFAKGAD
jgi:hypothetical protein